VNLYFISQNENRGYDTYDSAVVAAETEEAAREIHPSGMECDKDAYDWDGWCAKEYVKVKLIGKATEDCIAGVICASFNAG
jgi:hypothetical protein